MNEPWRTTTVTAIIHEMRRAQDYGNLPILADALTDADYPDEVALAGMRRGGVDAIDAERLCCELLGGEYADSLKWLDDFAAELGDKEGVEGYEEYGSVYGARQPMNYRIMMEAAVDSLERGSYLTEWGGERWRDLFYENGERFWGHFEVVTGRAVEDKDAQPFSCSC